MTPSSTTNDTFSSSIESLRDLGYCVLRLPDEPFERFDVQVFLREQIEFIDPTVGPKVMGGFGALGNPCSFHHRDLRRFRAAVYEFMFPFFCAAFPGQYMQCVADRFSVRTAGTSVGAESWHRDSSVPRRPGGLVCFGGWANLDAAHPQFLSCVPATHKDATDDDDVAAGFARLTSTEELESAAARCVQVKIPPRHCVVFNELLVHEVIARKQPRDSYRLYLKYIIATDGTAAPFGSQIIDRMRALGVPPYHVARRTNKRKKKRNFNVATGEAGEAEEEAAELVFEYPKMYSNNHVSGNCRVRFRIEDFSANIAAPFKAEVRAGLVNTGKVWVHRVMPALKEVLVGHDFAAIVPDYTESELDWFRPRCLLAAVVPSPAK